MAAEYEIDAAVVDDLLDERQPRRVTDQTLLHFPAEPACGIKRGCPVAY